MRKLASIVEISEILPIEGADRLEVAMMKGKGWRVVVGKGEFKVGDKAVYFEIDSALDPEDERYEFLKERCLRKFVSKGGNVLREVIKIKSIKLRGIVSQGLLMPIVKFPEITTKLVDGVDYLVGLPEGGESKDDMPPLVPFLGADVTHILKVEHFDEIKDSLQSAMGNPMCADALGTFPSDYIPKTDEERLQNLGDWFEKMKGRKWQVSVKHDGTSCTIAFSPTIDFENPLVVCSRNLRLKRETAAGQIPVYWQVAEQYDILNKLGDLFVGGLEYALQGEVVGPGIQKDRNKEKEYQFLCFRIWDIAKQQWLNPKETASLCAKLEIPHVQIIKDDFAFFDEIKTMDEALKFAEGKTNEGNEREGIVCKTVDAGPYASFKVVSNRYLLKCED